jgi:hypothetical protein
MSELWISGEIQADVDDSFRKARIGVESKLNPQIQGISLGGKVEEWIFIAIIRREDHPYYDEVAKKSPQGKALEFRLKIPHSEFVSASEEGQIRLLVKALLRSVMMMGQFGVSAETQMALSAALKRIEFEVV